MLSSVRKALTGVVAWFVIILLILAFALFGVPELQNFTQRPAIRVGDDGIPSQVVLNEFNRAMVNQRFQSDGGFSREEAIAQGLPDQIVTSLATRELLDQEARKIGLAMPRSLVREQLSADPRFQNPRTGKFDSEVMTNILQNYQYTARGFEQEIRETFLRQQLTDAIEGGATAPRAMSDALILRESEKRDIQYVTLTEEMSGIPEEPTPEKLRAYYDENTALFTAPEYRTFTVVSIRESVVREGLEAPEEDLRQLFESQKSRVYDQPEKRTIFQITYDTQGEAETAAAALEQGRKIDELARERGLTLDAVTFNDITKDAILDPTAADAAFAPDLGEGATSAPVKSLFGWTIIQVASITPPETKTFEDVRDEIEAQYLAQDTERKVYEAVETIEDARLTGADLRTAAESVAAATLQSFGPVDRFSFAPGGAIVDGLDGQVLSEAFELAEGDESEALEYGDEDGYFFVLLNEVTPPQLAEYETVEADVETRWRTDERLRRIERAAGQVREALAAGATMSEALKPFNTEPTSLTLVRRNPGNTFSQTLIEDIFTADLASAVTGSPPFGPEKIVAVIDKIDFDRTAVGPGQEIAFKQYVGLQLNQELLEAYLAALREDYDVRIDQSQIDSLFSTEQ